MSKVTELLWYELGDGLNATDVTEASQALYQQIIEIVDNAVAPAEGGKYGVHSRELLRVEIKKQLATYFGVGND